MGGASDDEEHYENRFKAQAPPKTNAQGAATRIRTRDGIIERTDPYCTIVDRRGKSFQLTKWHDPQSVEEMRTQMIKPAPVSKNKGCPIERFKKKLIERMGSGGLQAVGRIFRIMDDDHNFRLDPEELKTGLRDYGLDFHDDEIMELLTKVGDGNPHAVGFDQFLLAVRGSINPRRMKLIEMAFKSIDTTGDGLIKAEDIRSRFSPGHHPDVLAGRMEQDRALKHFFWSFDGTASMESDGVIHLNEFVEYYKNTSASIDNDDYFELMIRNAWHITGGEGWCENTSNTRVLVVLKDGTQHVVCIEHDLGLDLHDNAAVMRELKRQGCKDVVKFSLSGNV